MVLACIVLSSTMQHNRRKIRRKFKKIKHNELLLFSGLGKLSLYNNCHRCHFIYFLSFFFLYQSLFRKGHTFIYVCRNYMSQIYPFFSLYPNIFFSTRYVLVNLFFSFFIHSLPILALLFILSIFFLFLSLIHSFFLYFLFFIFCILFSIFVLLLSLIFVRSFPFSLCLLYCFSLFLLH